MIATKTGLFTPRSRSAISWSIGVKPSRPSIRKIRESASAIARRDCSRIKLNICSSADGTSPPVSTNWNRRPRYSHSA